LGQKSATVISGSSPETDLQCPSSIPFAYTAEQVKLLAAVSQSILQARFIDASSSLTAVSFTHPADSNSEKHSHPLHCLLGQPLMPMGAVSQ
jgi:hypothetical protein